MNAEILNASATNRNVKTNDEESLNYANKKQEYPIVAEVFHTVVSYERELSKQNIWKYLFLKEEFKLLLVLATWLIIHLYYALIRCLFYVNYVPHDNIRT